jgi:anti-sigma factor RsiW
VSTDEPHAPGVHPDLDHLADLQEGLLPPGPAAAISDHLEQCEACRADVAALAQVPARLAGAAEVGAFPDDLAGRLDQTLAEQPRAASLTITPLAVARRNRLNRDNRVLQAAAAAVLVLAATAIGVSAYQSGRDQGTSADSAAAGGSPREFSNDGSGTVLSTGTDYNQDTVVAAVPRLMAVDSAKRLANPEATAPSPGPANDAAGGGANRLSDPIALTACVTALSDDADTPVIERATPIVVDIAKYDHQPATVIVLPAPDRADRLDVFVVGPACGPADAALLHYTRVPRP